MRRWEHAERAARDWMRMAGFRGAELTRAGPDGGVDVRADDAVAQVKDQSRPVPASVVQALAGIASVENCQGLLFSSDGYTPDAISFARRARIALLTIDFFGEVRPFNDLAQQLSRPHDPQFARVPRHGDRVGEDGLYGYLVAALEQYPDARQFEFDTCDLTTLHVAVEADSSGSLLLEGWGLGLKRSGTGSIARSALTRTVDDAFFTIKDWADVAGVDLRHMRVALRELCQYPNVSSRLSLRYRELVEAYGAVVDGVREELELSGGAPVRLRAIPEWITLTFRFERRGVDVIIRAEWSPKAGPVGDSSAALTQFVPTVRGIAVDEAGQAVTVCVADFDVSGVVGVIAALACLGPYDFEIDYRA